MNGFLRGLTQFSKYVLELFIFPYALCRLIYEYVLFRKYVKILRRVVNNNDDFYNYLEKLDCQVDWLGRIYTVQPIPKEFRDFSDDELYDITMRSLLPMTKMLERNVLVDVCSIIISRVYEDAYIVCLTPFNFPQFLHFVKMSIASLVITVTGLVILSKYFII